MIKPAQDSKPPANQDGGTETRILDAAKAVFVRRGTAAARMHEIAEAAGVNQALLHYYFRTKAQLAAAVFTQAAAQLFPPVAEVLASDLSIEDKVLKVVEIAMTVLSKMPSLPPYIIGEINQAPERAAQLLETAQRLKSGGTLKRMMSVLQTQIDAQVANGMMRAISAQEFLTNLLALCIFPFATKPILRVILGVDDANFEQFLAARAKDKPRFFLDALRPLCTERKRRDKISGNKTINCIGAFQEESDAQSRIVAKICPYHLWRRISSRISVGDCLAVGLGLASGRTL